MAYLTADTGCIMLCACLLAAFKTFTDCFDNAGKYDLLGQL